MTKVEMIRDTGHAFDVFAGGDIEREIYRHVSGQRAFDGFAAVGGGYGQIAIGDTDFGEVEEVHAPDDQEAETEGREGLSPIPITRVEGERFGLEDENHAQSQQQQQRRTEFRGEQGSQNDGKRNQASPSGFLSPMGKKERGAKGNQGERSIVARDREVSDQRGRKGIKSQHEVCCTFREEAPGGGPEQKAQNYAQ